MEILVLSYEKMTPKSKSHDHCSHSRDSVASWRKYLKLWCKIVHVGIMKTMGTELVRKDNHKECFSRTRHQTVWDK